MAAVPYSPVPDVGVDPTPPTNRQSINPVGFQGVTALGDAASKVGDFYGNAAVDDGFNQLQAKGTKLLYGDPNVMVPGPGGTSAPQTGFLGLNGRSALDARPQVQTQLEDEITRIGSTMTSPELQLAFKQRADAYRTGFAGQTGSHANSQANVWYGAVNDATTANQLDLISSNSDFNPKTFAQASLHMVQAATKNASLAGAQPGDEVWNAAVKGAQEKAFVAQVQAIGTKDPGSALTLLNEHREFAGTQYDNLYTELRRRGMQSDGDALAQQAGSNYASTGASLVRPPSQVGQPAWLDAYLGNVKAQESGGSAGAKSSTSSATGLYQFIDSTWRGLMSAHPELGLTADGRTDPAQQERAVRAFTADNAKALTASRVPVTPGNLYLSAFFGPGGAAHLFDVPGSTPISEAMPANVISANRWLAGKTVDQVKAWAAGIAGKGIDPSVGGVGGAAPAAPQVPENVLEAPANVPVPQSPQDATTAAPVPPEGPGTFSAGTTPQGSASAKASIIQNILDADDSDLVAKYGQAGAWEVKQRAIAVATQQLSALQVAADQTAVQKKAANDQAMGGYVQKMLTPGSDLTGMQQSIAQDPNLTPETKLSLANALSAHADRTVAGATAAFGDGYWDAFKRLILPAGDPNRLSDPTEILKMAAPGPNGEAPAITLDGAAKLQQELSIATKSPDGSAVTTAKAGIINYAKQKMTFSHDPYYPGDRSGFDFKGEAIFNGQFIPKFEKAYSDWVGAGKPPFDFLNSDTADKLILGMRSPHDMAVEKLEATTGIDPSTLTAPPAPEGVDGDGWKLVVNSPPTMPDGKPSSVDKWTQAVTILQQQPTPERMAKFDAFFGQSGVHAQDVMAVLGIQPREMTPAEKQQAAPPAPPVAGVQPSVPAVAASGPPARTAKSGTGPTELGSGLFPPTAIPIEPAAAPLVTPRTANPAKYPPGATTVTPPKKPVKPHPSSF